MMPKKLEVSSNNLKSCPREVVDELREDTDAEEVTMVTEVVKIVDDEDGFVSMRL